MNFSRKVSSGPLEKRPKLNILKTTTKNLQNASKYQKNTSQVNIHPSNRSPQKDSVKFSSTFTENKKETNKILINTGHETPEYFNETVIKRNFLNLINDSDTSKKVLLQKFENIRNRLYYLANDTSFNLLGTEGYSDEPLNPIYQVPSNLNRESLYNDIVDSYSNTASFVANVKKPPTISFYVSSSDEKSLLATENLSDTAFNKKLYANYNSLIFQYKSILNNILSSMKVMAEDNEVLEPLSILSELQQPEPMMYSNMENVNSQILLMRKNADIMNEIISTITMMSTNGYSSCFFPNTFYPTGRDLPSVESTFAYLNNYNVGFIQYYSLILHVIICSLEQMQLNAVIISDSLYERVKATIILYLGKCNTLYKSPFMRGPCTCISKCYVGCNMSGIFLSNYLPNSGTVITSNNTFAVAKKNTNTFFGGSSIPNSSFFASINCEGYDSDAMIFMGDPSTGRFSSPMCTFQFDMNLTLINCIPNFNFYSTIMQSASRRLATNLLLSGNGVNVPFGENSDPTQTSCTINMPSSSNGLFSTVNLMGSTNFNGTGMNLGSTIATLVNPTGPSIAYIIPSDIIFNATSMNEEVTLAPEPMISVEQPLSKKLPIEVLYDQLTTLHSQIISYMNNYLLNEEFFYSGANNSLNPIYMGLQVINDALYSSEEPIFEELSYNTTMVHNIKFRNLKELLQAVYDYQQNNVATTKMNYNYTLEERLEYIQNQFSILNSRDSNLSLSIHVNLGGKTKFYTHNELPDCQLNTPLHNILSYDMALFIELVNLISNNLHPKAKTYISEIIKALKPSSFTPSSYTKPEKQ